MYRLLADCPDYLVLDKQSGVSIHNESGRGLIQQLRQELDTPVYPVHRLDKDTSGLLICAKSTLANKALSQLFQQRRIEKYYLAVSVKKPIKKQGLILGDMLRTRGGSWKLSRSRSNPAVTQFFSYGLGDGRRLFLLKPYTGKTHQLRVALKSIGAPITGDKRYGGAVDSLNRLCLHAYCLRFNYQGVEQVYQSVPVPPAFDKTIQNFVDLELRAPWQLNWPSLPEQLCYADH